MIVFQRYKPEYFNIHLKNLRAFIDPFYLKDRDAEFSIRQLSIRQDRLLILDSFERSVGTFQINKAFVFESAQKYGVNYIIVSDVSDIKYLNKVGVSLSRIGLVINEDSFDYGFKLRDRLGLIIVDDLRYFYPNIFNPNKTIIVYDVLIKYCPRVFGILTNELIKDDNASDKNYTKIEY